MSVKAYFLSYGPKTLEARFLDLVSTKKIVPEMSSSCVICTDDDD